MKHLNHNFLSALVALCICLLSINVYAADASPEASRSDAASEEWEFILELYGWLPDIEVTSAGGTDVKIDIETIVENLDLIVFTTFGARKKGWHFMADVIYMDISDDPDQNLGRLLQLTDIEMKAWVFNPFVSYEIFGSKKGSFQLLAGARFLDIEVELGLKTRPPLDPGKSDGSFDDNVWDGVVGIRGFYNLTDRWFVPYRVDVGTGDTDYTWHVLAGIGYKFDSFKMLAGYRHLEWEFEDDAALKDLQVSGPIVGAIFIF